MRAAVQCAQRTSVASAALHGNGWGTAQAKQPRPRIVPDCMPSGAAARFAEQNELLIYLHGVQLGSIVAMHAIEPALAARRKNRGRCIQHVSAHARDAEALLSSLRVSLKPGASGVSASGQANSHSALRTVRGFRCPGCPSPSVLAGARSRSSALLHCRIAAFSCRALDMACITAYGAVPAAPLLTSACTRLCTWVFYSSGSCPSHSVAWRGGTGRTNCRHSPLRRSMSGRPVAESCRSVNCTMNLPPLLCGASSTQACAGASASRGSANQRAHAPSGHPPGTLAVTHRQSAGNATLNGAAMGTRLGRAPLHARTLPGRGDRLAGGHFVGA